MALERLQPFSSSNGCNVRSMALERLQPFSGSSVPEPYYFILQARDNLLTIRREGNGYNIRSIALKYL
jgi:hypothetical protein